MLRFLLLLLCGNALLPQLAYAQTTVAGRVLDAKSGDGLAGVTVLQTGTTNGVSSDVEGDFTLRIAATTDSIALTISSIGYLTQQRRVAASGTSTFRLAIDNRTISCDLYTLPRAEVGLSSGVRYAPFGATLRLYGQRLLRLPVLATIGYQTNFSRNYAVNASLGLPPLWQRNRLTIFEKLDYQFLQAIPADICFRSYTATVDVGIYRIGQVRLPTITLGGGYARVASPGPEASAAVAGYGYLLGLSSSRLPLNFIGSASATHWPGYWQRQARLQHYFPGYLLAGVSFNQIRSYSEFSLAVSRTF